MEYIPTVSMMMFEAAPVGILLVDGEGQVLLANPKAAEMFGYTPSELVGESVEVLLPERLRADHPQHRAEFIAHPRVRPMGIGLELLGRRKDGTEFPAEISLGYMKLDDAKLLTLAFIADITRRKESEQLVRQLSTPILPIFDRCLLVPIVGALEPWRASQVASVLLKAVREDRAKVVVIDFTGVPTLEPHVATSLMNTVKAVRLLGAVPILAGVSQNVAEALIRYQPSFVGLKTTQDLRGAIEEAAELLGHRGPNGQGGPHHREPSARFHS